MCSARCPGQTYPSGTAQSGAEVGDWCWAWSCDIFYILQSPFSVMKPQPTLPVSGPAFLGLPHPYLEQPRAPPLFWHRERACIRSREAGVVVMYLEESTDFRELGLGSEEAKCQHRTDMLRYGVEMGDEAIGHLW